MKPRPTKSEKKDDWQHLASHPKEKQTLLHKTLTYRLKRLNKPIRG